MQEELEIVVKDIKDLEKRLQILKKREKNLRNKIELPTHLIGKCIKYEKDNCISYLKIKEVSKSEAFDCVMLIGLYLRIDYFAAGNYYNIHNHGISSYKPEGLEIITEEEFNKVKKEIITHFN